MKHLIFSAFILVFFLSFISPVNAGDKSKELIPIFANAQKEAVKDVLTCFRKGATAEKWGNALKDLVGAEIGMINYGVSYKSDKLYSKLASDLPPTQYPLFGFRVFEKRLKNAGYEFSSFNEPFTGKHYLRFANSYDKITGIVFK
ncbi:MAG: hypothetical protein HOJ48_00060 [Desulfobacula sp.]|jgi:hypothetical protein|nr:hypothetical protein [Desulfobacula sp.]